MWEMPKLNIMTDTMTQTMQSPKGHEHTLKGTTFWMGERKIPF
jgi:hypothetical protein